jgi:hypothetical protein
LYRCDVGAVTAGSAYGFFLERRGRDGVDLHTERDVKVRVMLAPALPPQLRIDVEHVLPPTIQSKLEPVSNRRAVLVLL